MLISLAMPISLAVKCSVVGINWNTRLGKSRHCSHNEHKHPLLLGLTSQVTSAIPVGLTPTIRRYGTWHLRFCTVQSFLALRSDSLCTSYCTVLAIVGGFSNKTKNGKMHFLDKDAEVLTSAFPLNGQHTFAVYNSDAAVSVWNAEGLRAYRIDEPIDILYSNVHYVDVGDQSEKGCCEELMTNYRRLEMLCDQVSVSNFAYRTHC